MSTLTETLKPTPEEISDARFKAYAAEGYTKQYGDRIVTDVAPLIVVLRTEVLKYQPESRTDRKSGMVQVADLAAVAFPSHPSPDTDEWKDASLLTKAVWQKLESDVKAIVKTGRRGSIQNTLDEDEATQHLVLCERLMGKPQVPCVYVTSNAQLIDDDYTTPRASRLKNVSAELATDLEEVVLRRHPEMKSKVNKTWKDAEKEAHAVAAAKLAITAGEDAS